MYIYNSTSYSKNKHTNIFSLKSEGKKIIPGVQEKNIIVKNESACNKWWVRASVGNELFLII